VRTTCRHTCVTAPGLQRTAAHKPTDRIAMDHDSPGPSFAYGESLGIGHLSLASEATYVLMSACVTSLLPVAP
jgi:hypothetical protein